MTDEKWYYRITEIKSGESVLASCSLPIKEEKLCELMGLEGYTAKAISKDEYEEESEDVESRD